MHSLFLHCGMAGKDKNGISYAFIEFGDQEECKSAKNKLATTQFKGKEVYVDFVGENSKAKKKSGKQKGGLNPTRLFVCGLAKGVNKTNLKEMFPKAAHADIPQRSKKKGTTFGFVQFSTPADAKAAFDAAQDLSINNHKITVLFAKESETRKKKEAEKRKVNDETSNEVKKDNATEGKKAENTVKEEKNVDITEAKRLKLEKKQKGVEKMKEESKVEEEEAVEDAEEEESENELDDTVKESEEEKDEDDNDDDDEDDNDDEDDEDDEDDDEAKDGDSVNEDGDDDDE